MASMIDFRAYTRELEDDIEGLTDEYEMEQRLEAFHYRYSDAILDEFRRALEEVVSDRMEEVAEDEAEEEMYCDHCAAKNPAECYCDE